MQARQAEAKAVRLKAAFQIYLVQKATGPETISSPDAAMFGLQRSHSMLLAQHSPPPPDAYGGQQPATAGNVLPTDGTRVTQGQQATPFSPPQFSNDAMNLSPVDLISPPPPAASGDPGIGGRSTDEMDEWSGWRRRPVGLRALAGAREMGTVSQRRSRPDIRARRRQSSVAGITVMAQETGDKDAMNLSPVGPDQSSSASGRR
ncbi:hypothetical protein HPB50_007760 [Hyalomma asiaticum]|uniref:Uncharacterized protein n=1 Tax=Hyalomma asiaticum TaxID=266040 RepID=A0ACB7SUC5_HYAAI|nr:hypothetical protein HPB50_007760 [Hyalomma asiaticum]